MALSSPSSEGLSFFNHSILSFLDALNAFLEKYIFFTGKEILKLQRNISELAVCIDITEW